MNENITCFLFIYIRVYIVYVCMHTWTLVRKHTCIIICIGYFTSQNCTHVELTYEHTYIVIYKCICTYCMAGKFGGQKVW